MIHDYYLENWKQEKENSLQEKKKEEFKGKSDDEKYEEWLEEVFIRPLAKEKKKILDNLLNEWKGSKNVDDLYPELEDLKNLPQNSVLIKISFTLKKPYTSKDEGEFHIIEEEDAFIWKDKQTLIKYLKKKNVSLKEEDIKIEDDRITFENGEVFKEGVFAYLKISDGIKDWFIIIQENNNENLYTFKVFENPISRDKFTGLPMVRPTTWKGHLRFAAEKVEWNGEEERKRIISRLFGSESGDETALKGRLYFFPTFFKDEVERDVITPLKRDTRTPARGPIFLEVMKPSKGGEFYLLYVPYPKGKDFIENEIEEDLKFLAKALKLMFYTYGFSAKKTSGFGVIERLKENEIEVYPENRKDIFSILYTKQNKTVKDGA